MPSAISDNKRIQNRAGGESRRKSAAIKSLNFDGAQRIPVPRPDHSMLRSAPPQTSNKIIQKGLAFRRPLRYAGLGLLLGDCRRAQGHDQAAVRRASGLMTSRIVLEATRV